MTLEWVICCAMSILVSKYACVFVLIRFLQFMSAFLLVKSVNFFCNSFSTQSLKAIVEVSIKCQHFATFWQIIYNEIKNQSIAKFESHRGSSDQVSTFGSS